VRAKFGPLSQLMDFSSMAKTAVNKIRLLLSKTGAALPLSKT
jgi:hypothetical protein